jgi:hypothetical protein
MADPILESSLKTYYVLWNFLLLNETVDKFQRCFDTAASLFPFSCMTFLIGTYYTKKFWTILINL